MITFLWIIIIFAALIMLELAWATLALHKTNVFQKTLKHHDRCNIYIGNEKIDGHIVAIFDDNITVEDEDGNFHNLQRSEIYPLLTHRRHAL